MQNTVGNGNFHSGFLNRKLGKGGIQSTAKRIERMLKNNNTESAFYSPSIAFIIYLSVIWELSNKDTITDKKDREIIKRLLQELEVLTFFNLSKEEREVIEKEFN